jgi:alpha-glucosidase (family GH31 glycosyl hydrolase)
LDLNTFSTYQGGKSYLIEASLEHLPCFLRGGAIIPSRDVQQFTDQKPLTELILEIYPANETGLFFYYEDDGNSFDYQDGGYNLTKFDYVKQENKIIFNSKFIHNEFSSNQKNLMIHFYKTDFKSLCLNGQQLKETNETEKSEGYSYNPQLQKLTVFIRQSGKPFSLEIRQ